MNKRFWPIMLIGTLLSAFCFSMAALASAVEDVKTEYFENGCLVEVHKNNHLFDKDTVKITRHCQ